MRLYLDVTAFRLFAHRDGSGSHSLVKEEPIP